MNRIENKVAIVTGGTQGLGAAIAWQFAQAGAKAILTCGRHAENGSQVSTKITQSTGVPVVFVEADLESVADCRNVVSQADTRFGQVDILVNAAGINPRQPADDVTPQSWNQTIQLNLSTPFFFAQALVPGMKAAGYGRIINIASLQSVRAFPDGIAYGASKGGVCQLTRAMAEAWSSDGITCNAIAPGFFPTELTAPVFDDNERRRWAADQTAIGRNGELKDLAGISVFLASPASDYITGQTIFVDGGFTAR